MIQSGWPFRISQFQTGSVSTATSSQAVKCVLCFPRYRQGGACARVQQAPAVHESPRRRCPPIPAQQSLQLILEAPAADLHAAAQPTRRSGLSDECSRSPAQFRPCGPDDRWEAQQRVRSELLHGRRRPRRCGSGGCPAAALPAEFQRRAPVRCYRGRLCGRGHGVSPAAARQPRGACARPPV